MVTLVLLMAACAYAQEPKQEKTPPTLRSILLEQLQTTHNKQDWFVSIDTAVAGLTPEQAAWIDGKGNHSVGQLVYHMLYWDRRALAKFNGQPEEKYSGNNDDTFTAYDAKKWAATVQELDQVMSQWEQAVQSADDAKLAKWAPIIARIGTHNAYHTGEIVMVRKEQGSWNAEKGVH
jgi:uncharacterized damage-inducible protein DinB